MLIALKLTLAPAFLLALSLAGRRWGSAVSGWFVALPVVAGPIVLFLGLEQGAAFASRAAHATLTGIVSLMLYCLVYARVALRRGWPACLLAGWAAFVASTALLDRAPLPLAPSFLATLASVALVRAAMPRPSGEERPPDTGWTEIGARMAAAAAMVLLLTGVARPLGPRLAGLLTPFPVAATVLTVFTHRHQGGASAIRVLRGLVGGLWTMALFFLVIASTAQRFGIALSFAAAAAADLLAHGGAFWWVRRRAARIPR